jgi:hypothetical protein
MKSENGEKREGVLFSLGKHIDARSERNKTNDRNNSTRERGGNKALLLHDSWSWRSGGGLRVSKRECERRQKKKLKKHENQMK